MNFDKTQSIPQTEPTEEELSRVYGGGQEPSPDPGPVPSGTIVGRAKQELGKPYAWGGIGPDSYDASGFVSYCLTGVYGRIGTPSTFMGWPRAANPAPGDVCVSSGHCGIYVSPGTMIHAPGPGQTVSCGPIQGGMIIVRRP